MTEQGWSRAGQDAAEAEEESVGLEELADEARRPSWGALQLILVIVLASMAYAVLVWLLSPGPPVRPGGWLF